MEYVATIISSPQMRALTPEIAAGAARTVCDAAACRWLAEGIACDIFFAADTDTAREAETRLRAALAGHTLDIAVLPAAGRRKRLLIADMDSTIIGQETIDEIADALGLKQQVAAITERAMRGEIAFEPALEERVALLRGLERAALERVRDERLRLNPGARRLVMTMRAHGAVTALVSGGFTLFARTIAERAGFAHHFANVLEFDGDRLSGAVRPPVLGARAKREALERLRRESGLTRDETLAIGDGANDIDMLEAAGLGIAYRAKPALAQTADARIEHGDLTAALYLQGYTLDEFAANA